MEELIDVAEREAKWEVYGLLKRPDEKYVTESAYDNPSFAEDTVFDRTVALNMGQRLRAYVVEVASCELIHKHSASVMIEHDKESSEV